MNLSNVGTALDHFATSRRRVLTAVALLALTMRFGYWAYAGTRISPDGHTYLGTCQTLFTDPVGYLGGFVGIEYIGFMLPFCTWTEALHLPAGSWVALQVLMGTTTALLLADGAWRWWGSRSALLVGIGYAVLWENAQWDVYLLSESLFLLSLSLVLWTFVRWRIGEASWGWFAGAVAWAALSRPVGVPMLVLGLLAWVLAPWAWREAKALVERGAAVAGAVALLIVPGWISDRPSWTTAIVDEVWAISRIVHDDPAFDLSLPLRPASGAASFILSNPWQWVVMAVAKVGAFYVPVVARFSMLHNLLNVVTLVPVLLIGAGGIGVAWRARDAALLPALAIIVGATAVAAITFVDYDFRYRAPAALGFCWMMGAVMARARPQEQVR